MPFELSPTPYAVRHAGSASFASECKDPVHPQGRAPFDHKRVPSQRLHYSANTDRFWCHAAIVAATPADVVLRFREKRWNEARQQPLPQPDIFTDRFVSGHGSERGSVITLLGNRGTALRNVTLLQIVPWVFRVYTNSIEITVNPLSGGETTHVAEEPLASSSSRLKLALDRQTPLVWEQQLSLPANSLTRVRWDFGGLRLCLVSFASFSHCSCHA